MSDPYGTTPPDPNDPARRQPPAPSTEGEPASGPDGTDPATHQPGPPPAPYGYSTPPVAPQHGQPAAAPPAAAPPAAAPPAYGQPDYGQSAPGQAGVPAYGQTYADPASAPQYGEPAPYGAMPTAPRPADPYGASAFAAHLRVGDAFRFAWAKFKNNWLSWVLFTVLMGAVYAAFNADQWGQTNQRIQNLLDGNTLAQTGVTFGATLLSLIGLLLTAALGALATHAALTEADGARPTFASFFKAPRLGTAVLTSIIVSVLTGIAAVFTFGLGGIALAIFTVFAVPYVIDRGTPVFGSIGDSFGLVGRNFGSVLLLLLALVGINLLGVLALGLGLLVTIPLSLLAIAYAFRRLTGGTIV